jgi:hypothetical protein
MDSSDAPLRKGRTAVPFGDKRCQEEFCLEPKEKGLGYSEEADWGIVAGPNPGESAKVEAHLHFEEVRSGKALPCDLGDLD